DPPLIGLHENYFTNTPSSNSSGDQIIHATTNASGGNGDDYIVGLVGGLNLSGGEGNDILIGGTSTSSNKNDGNILSGGACANFLYGGLTPNGAVNQLNAGAGDDILVGAYLGEVFDTTHISNNIMKGSARNTTFFSGVGGDNTMTGGSGENAFLIDLV